MQPSTILFVAVNFLGLASAAAVSAPDNHAIEKRACFQSGATWGGDKAKALESAKTACNKDFKGRWQKRETVVKCYNIGNSKSVKFTVGLTGPNAPGSRDLGYDECVSGLSSEINSCGRGGDTTYGNWRYRADPNAEFC